MDGQLLHFLRRLAAQRRVALELQPRALNSAAVHRHLDDPLHHFVALRVLRRYRVAIRNLVAPLEVSRHLHDRELWIGTWGDGYHLLQLVWIHAPWVALEIVLRLVSRCLAL